MRCADVNVLVYAHRREAPDHQRYLAWLEGARRADEPLGVSSLILSGFVRVVTHPRVFRSPTSLAEALAFAARVRAAPNAVALTPGPRHWDIFTGLGERADVRGNLVPDAYLAALAIESGATFYSADRGFSRFPTLRWRHPLDAG
ncbi:MAG: type II toxin-antitoxin system VapC family toxin [Egibacteraceae bacterium]